MSEKVLKFLRVVGAQFSKRHQSPTDEKIWFDSMIDGLRDYDASVLDRAAKRIINTKTDPGFPYLAECRKVCEDIVKFDKLAEPKAFDDDPGRKFKGHAGWQYRLADELIMCGLGKRAAHEGWILVLHDFCRNNGRLPKDWEIRDCIASAKGFDEAYQALLRDKATGRAGPLHDSLIRLGDGMVARAEKYRERVLGAAAA